MKLIDYLEATHTSPTEFARRIGVNERESVRRYIAGTRIPAPRIMRQITDETKGAVQPNDFYPASAA